MTGVQTCALPISTGDLEGSVVEERPVHANRSDVQGVLPRFLGAVEQLPPMHSALKHEGRALYEYARAGQDVPRQPRRVTIHAIDIVDWQPPMLVIDVHCSKGTYIRTLAEDIGTALGCGAHLAALRRTGSGPLDLKNAITLEALAERPEAERDALLLPPDALLAGWPEVRLPADEAGRFLTGLRRRVSLGDAPAVRVYGTNPTAFLGSAHIQAGELIADRLLSPLEVQVQP